MLTLDIGSLKFLNTFLKNVCTTDCGEIWTKSYGRRLATNEINFELSDKKRGFYNHIWQWTDDILEDVSVAGIIV